MTSAWINYVKETQAKHGCSYKDAMQLASQTYQKKEGAGLKSVMRKVGKTAKQVRKGARKVSNEVSKHQDFINLINPEAGKALESANSKFNEVDAKLGGKFNLHKAVRKTKSTVKRARKITKSVAPLVAMANPEAGLALEALSVGSGNRYIKAISGGGCDKCKCGGSFAVPKRGGSFQNTNSTLLNPQHPGFAPLKPKSKARQQKEN